MGCRAIMVSQVMEGRNRMVSSCKQLTLHVPFSGRLRRGEKNRESKPQHKTNSMTFRMPVFCWKEFLELKSPRVGHRRPQVVFTDFFTEIPHQGYHSEQSYTVSALKEPVEDQLVARSVIQDDKH